MRLVNGQKFENGAFLMDKDLKMVRFLTVKNSKMAHILVSLGRLYEIVH